MDSRSSVKEKAAFCRTEPNELTDNFDLAIHPFIQQPQLNPILSSAVVTALLRRLHSPLTDQRQIVFSFSGRTNIWGYSEDVL